MIKKIGFLLAGAMGLYALEACVLVDCQKDPTNAACADNSGGAGVGGGGGSDQGGAGGMATGGTGGTGGAGGGGTVCAEKCGDALLFDPAKNETIIPLCATASADSVKFLKELDACVCAAGGACEPECGKTAAYCKGADNTTLDACKVCLSDTTKACANLVQACGADI